MKKHKLDQVFVATDADEEGNNITAQISLEKEAFRSKNISNATGTIEIIRPGINNDISK